MANVSIKISQLKSLTGSAITRDDFLPVVDSGSGKTYKVTLGDIVDLSNESVVQLLGGQNKQLIFNQGGVLNGNAALTFNYISSSLQQGSGSIANGKYSHAEGFLTYISGVAAHAEGYNTFAYGDYSHAEGYNAFAYGSASHAGGYQTYAYDDFQTVVGKFNSNGTASTSSYISGAYASGAVFVVGGGTSDTDRKDILIVRPNLVTIDGDVDIIGSLSYNNASVVVNSSSYSRTASYAMNVNTNSLPDITDTTQYNRIGINNTNPQYTLDVSGSINFTGNLLQNGISYMASQSISASYGLSSSYALSSSWAYSSSIQLPDITDDTVNNFVGINTNSPAYTLDVAGTINAYEVRASEIALPTSSFITMYTGSIFYSASTLWVYTGTANDYGSGAGWATASLSI